MAEREIDWPAKADRRCRTGCGCKDCGPIRRNPITFEYPDELDEILTSDGPKRRREESETP